VIERASRPAVSGGAMAGQRNVLQVRVARVQGVPVATTQSRGTSLLAAIGSRMDVAAYYFPGWHGTPRNDRWKAPGWTEWSLVREATPRFDGHAQPKRPIWGEYDEADPAVMRRAARAARDHGIDAFIFDWYWYDGPFLDGALRAFLAADDDLAFGLMWANHDWLDIFPATPGEPPALLAPSRNTGAEFDQIIDHLCEHFLGHDRFWQVDGGRYVSIFEFDRFVAGLGGADATAKVLDRFRRRVQEAGFGELHLNVTWHGLRLGPPDSNRYLRTCGVDSVTLYNWHDVVRLGYDERRDYADLAKRTAAMWPTLAEFLPVPLASNVTVGWDCSPRTAQDHPHEVSAHPFLAIVEDIRPADITEALLTAMRWSRAAGATYVTVNAWNEWTEGAYLEPDEEHGWTKLAAVRDAVTRDVTASRSVG
jgi:hypothetical protein